MRGSIMRGATVNLDYRRIIQDANNTLNYVVDVGKIALHAAIVIDLDWSAFQYRFAELEHGHVRPTPRTVHGEKAQTRDRQTIKVSIHMSNQFVALLGCSIKTDWMVDTVAP